MAKVLYIAGWGRSGTTIVDNVLNSCESVFSTGELFYLWQRGIVHRRKCGCGERFQLCSLWQEILRAAFGDRLPDPGRVIALQQQAVRVRHTPSLVNEPLTEEAEEYRKIYARLYHAIADVTGARLIVDSSKVPSAAALLTRMSGVDPYLLHMVRDPRAVTHSWMGAAREARSVNQMPLSSTVHWLVRNAMTERLARVFPHRYQRLRYEDFAAQPRATIDRLLAFTGLPGTKAPFIEDATVVLRPNHTIAGNPARFKNGEIAVRPDNRWRHEQNLAPRLTTTALSLPLLHHYGYRARPVR
jgi:hypothetical protein